MSSTSLLGHLELLAAWGLVASAFALIVFRWEPSRGRGHRRRSGGRPAFAVDRARALFAERVDAAGVSRAQMLSREQRESTGRNGGPSPGAHPAEPPVEELVGRDEE